MLCNGSKETLHATFLFHSVFLYNAPVIILWSAGDHFTFPEIIFFTKAQWHRRKLWHPWSQVAYSSLQYTLDSLIMHQSFELICFHHPHPPCRLWGFYGAIVGKIWLIYTLKMPHTLGTLHHIYASIVLNMDIVNKSLITWKTGLYSIFKPIWRSEPRGVGAFPLMLYTGVGISFNIPKTKM